MTEAHRFRRADDFHLDGAAKAISDMSHITLLVERYCYQVDFHQGTSIETFSLYRR